MATASLFDEAGVLLPDVPAARSLLPRMRAFASAPVRLSALVASGQTTRTEIERSSATQFLLWSLRVNGIAFTQCDVASAPTDLSAFDVVLFWPYGNKRRIGFRRDCKSLENVAIAAGVPVVNSLSGCDCTHSWSLELMRRSGVPCPAHQKFRSVSELHLDYPLILRTDRVHCGENMFLVHNADESASASRNADPPLDLAIRYIDTRWSDGLYRKWRVHVVGGAVIPRQLEVSPDWKVDLPRGHRAAIAEDQEFARSGEQNCDLMVRAAEAVYSDIVALDYTRTEGGAYIFWEANRAFDLSVAGEMLTQFQAVTGRSDEECIQSFRRLGDAIAQLLFVRAAARRGA